MLLEKPGGGVPGQFGRLAIVHRLPLLVDETVFGVIAKKFERPACRLHGLLERLDQLWRAPVVLISEMGLQRNFPVRRLFRLVRRSAVEPTAPPQLPTFR